MPDSFNIRLQFNKAELLAASFYVVSGMKIIRHLGVILIILLVLSIPFLFFTLALLGIVTVILATTFIVLLLVNFYAFQKQAGSHNNLSYEFTHWGMNLAGDSVELSKPWRTISHAKETDLFFILFVENKTHFIQKRMLGNKSTIDAFRKLLQKNISTIV